MPPSRESGHPCAPSPSHTPTTNPPRPVCGPLVQVVVPQGTDESGLYPISVLDPLSAGAVRDVHVMDALVDYLQVGHYAMMSAHVQYAVGSEGKLVRMEGMWCWAGECGGYRSGAALRGSAAARCAALTRTASWLVTLPKDSTSAATYSTRPSVGWQDAEQARAAAAPAALVAGQGLQRGAGPVWVRV